MDPCDKCEGRGWVLDKCHVCGGSGETLNYSQAIRSNELADYPSTDKCSICGGHGLVARHCTHCRGTGVVI